MLILTQKKKKCDKYRYEERNAEVCWRMFKVGSALRQELLLGRTSNSNCCGGRFKLRPAVCYTEEGPPPSVYINELTNKSSMVLWGT